MPVGGIHTEADLLAFLDQNRTPAANPLSGLFTYGTGAPTDTPKSRSLYVQLDGGTGSTFYVYDGTSWVAVA